MRMESRAGNQRDMKCWSLCLFQIAVAVFGDLISKVGRQEGKKKLRTFRAVGILEQNKSCLSQKLLDDLLQAVGGSEGRRRRGVHLCTIRDSEAVRISKGHTFFLKNCDVPVALCAQFVLLLACGQAKVRA